MAPLVRRGGIATKSPREAVTGVEIAFACLPTPEVSRAVAFGADGVNGVKACVSMSRCRPSVRKTIKAIAAELAKSDVAVLDSPVSGGPRGARAGTLATMVFG